jgi:hypothetical protein
MTLVFASPVPRLSSQRLMLLALADNANDQGVCWPSIKLLAAKCASEYRNARRTLAQLEKDGLIERLHKEGKRSTYQINTEALTQGKNAPGKNAPGDEETPGKNAPTPQGKNAPGTQGKNALPTTLNRQLEPSDEPSENPPTPLDEESPPEESPQDSGQDSTWDPAEQMKRVYSDLPEGHRWAGYRPNVVQADTIRHRIRDPDAWDRALQEWIEGEYSPRQNANLIDCYHGYEAANDEKTRRPDRQTNPAALLNPGKDEPEAGRAVRAGVPGGRGRSAGHLRGRSPAKDLSRKRDGELSAAEWLERAGFDPSRSTEEQFDELFGPSGRAAPEPSGGGEGRTP